MQFYKTTRNETDPNPGYDATRTEAHDRAKLQPESHEVRIELVEIAVDKEALVAILNGEKPTAKVIKTWTLTTRGGLRDCENGE